MQGSPWASLDEQEENARLQVQGLSNQRSRTWTTTRITAWGTTLGNSRCCGGCNMTEQKEQCNLIFELFYQELQYLLMNFNGFVFLKSAMCIFFCHISILLIAAHMCSAYFLHTYTVFVQRLWCWRTQALNFSVGFCSVPWMAISGITISVDEFQYFCVLEISNVHIPQRISILLSAAHMCSAYFSHTYTVVSMIFTLTDSTS